jgi:hypothetical protein
MPPPACDVRQHPHDLTVTYAGFAVSLVAVIIAGIALWRGESRARRAESRDERRMTREEEAAAERRRGKPVLTPSGISGGPTADPVHHNYMLRNSGAAVITELTLSIEDGDGNVVSSPAGGQMMLSRDDPPVAIGVDVRQPLPELQTLVVEWVDADGRHREERGHPPRHA